MSTGVSDWLGVPLALLESDWLGEADMDALALSEGLPLPVCVEVCVREGV